ncbi:type III secretion system outer membrane ring subunit SctC [Pseudomonas sp. nanlin1]|uniref:type III secretion system outer membrane ring subunit SctC n=1 Tax=Pseudomonas sp. nanlin1 TaxID=3040605 RepID=UPI00388CF932
MMAAMLWATPTLAVVPEQWRDTPYAYDAKNAPLGQVLKDFAESFGVKLIADDINGTVNGRMRSESPEAFLDRLGLEHQFQWFVYNNSLYVSPIDQQQSTRIEVDEKSVDDLNQALTDVGLLDPRFGWGALPEQGVVLVRGPRRYVELIQEFSQKQKSRDEKQEVIYLPLRYANAADRPIKYRGESLKIDGVASLLRNLLERRASSLGGSALSADALRSGSLSGVPGMGGFGADASNFPQLFDDSRSSNFAGQNYLPPSADERASSRSRNHIRVEADVRNNAVLIYDDPERRAIYKDLVEELDKPRNVIEIDAIIVDVDRSKMDELSSNWGLSAGNFSGGASLAENGRSSTMFVQDQDRFFAGLRALEGEGLASVIGNPSVLTLENQPAVIDFSQTEILEAVGERVANFEPLTAGTSLQVIPRSITPANAKDQMIQLVVDIEDGQIEQSTIRAEQPSVRRGNVSTQAVIAEKASLVVGGFHVYENNRREKRVPYLSAIPILGKLLFTARERNESNRERLFILTPRLIGDQVNPMRYVEYANPNHVQDRLDKIKQRREGPDRPNRNAVSNALRDMIQGSVPAGFAAAAIPLRPETLCDGNPALQLDPRRAQWYAGDQGFGIAVALVRNTGDTPQRVDEASCGGRYAVGVSVWPDAWVAPGSEAEVFIALRPPKVNSGAPQRRSLLSHAEAR